MDTLLPAIAIALTLMLIARPVSVFLCLWPFRFPLREKAFISWVGLRGAVGIFLASIPMLVGMPKAYIYFDVAFVVVVVSLLVQGWTIAVAAHRLHVALPRTDRQQRRIELDLPGQLDQELVGYAIAENSPYLRRRLIPSWAKPTLFVRDERILTPEEAREAQAGDYVYLLAPPDKAQALDRFFVNMPPPPRPDPRLLGDFFVPGDAGLGALADIYGLQIADDHADVSLAAHFEDELKRAPKQGDIVQLGPIALLAHVVTDGKLKTVGLRLADPDEESYKSGIDYMRSLFKRARKYVLDRP
jgi:cell volume regulation protein A